MKRCSCGKPVKGRGKKCSACYSRDYRRKPHATQDVHVRLDPETRQQLNEVVRRQGTTRATKIREYIEWGLENE